jgi:hypothetical protein
MGPSQAVFRLPFTGTAGPAPREGFPFREESQETGGLA